MSEFHIIAACEKSRLIERHTVELKIVSSGDKRGMEKTKNRRRKKDRKDYNVGPTERQKER